MDITKLPISQLKEVISWCEKHFVEIPEVTKLLAIFKKKDDPSKKATKKEATPRVRKKHVHVHDYKELRKLKGLTQAEAAAQMNIKTQTLSTIESGISGGSAETLAKINNFYGVD